jgi:hypothetical protein
MRAVTTAGERVVVDCAVPRFEALLAAATAGELSQAASPDGTVDGTVHLDIQASRRPFGRARWALISRGVWAAPPRVLLADACSSGFDLLVEPAGSVLHVTARYRPGPRARAANTLLAGRFRLLAAQTLLHYPALWWASLHGRVPLHVSVLAGPGGVTMLAGPSGVGKSTLLAAGLRRGETATADNVCACDSHSAFGLVEPLRLDGAGGTGPAAPHGRREYPFSGRQSRLDPDRVVVLRRGLSADHAPAVRQLLPGDAARELVTGTYMAGELRRFWPFAATLALATGLGPAHPDVTGVANALADRLPCLEIRLSSRPSVPVGELLEEARSA